MVDDEILTLLSPDPEIEEKGVDYSEEIEDLTENETIEDKEDDGPGQTKNGGEISKGVGRETIEKEAKVFVSLINTVTCRAASMYSGAGRENYQLDEKEKEELTNATADWMVATQTTINPTTTFIITLSAIFFHIGSKAHEDKKALDRSKQAKMIDKKINEGEKIDPKEAEVIKKVAENLSERAQFKMDSDGYYFYANKEKGGGYIRKKSDREKAPGFIVDIVTKMKKEGKSESDINQACKDAIAGKTDVNV